MERAGIPLDKPEDQQVLDVYQIYRTMEPHTLERAVAEYTGRPFHQSHQALDDVEATAQVLAAQLARYELSGSLRDVIATVRYPYLDGEGKLKAEGEQIVVCFGKHEGRTIQDIASDDPSYLDWVASEIGGEIGRIISTRRQELHPSLSG
jgi:DNA polymerase-3 subunit epsilon